MRDPSLRCTLMAFWLAESMVTRHTWLTSDNDRMLAMECGLNHTSPRLGKSPTWVESWWPPLVIARRVRPLSRMLVIILGLLNTDIVL